MSEKTGRKTAWFALGAAAGFYTALWLIERSQDMQGLPSWLKVLEAHYGPMKAHYLAEAIRQHYRILLIEEPLPENPVLRRHATDFILPGLALYQVLLRENHGDKKAALAEVDEAFRVWTLEQYRVLGLMKIIPMPFSLFRKIFAQRMKDFPTEGWDFVPVEDSPRQIAFNATRCFYLNTLTAYGAPELTASFCKTDDVMAEMFPPNIRFVRNKTLGRGDDRCDFCYRTEE